MSKYTIAQILAAWEAAYGEDMTTEYPGFMQRLTEEDEQKTGSTKYKNINTACQMVRGQRLQATSGKLQAPSCKLDKKELQDYKGV